MFSSGVLYCLIVAYQVSKGQSGSIYKNQNENLTNYYQRPSYAGQWLTGNKEPSIPPGTPWPADPPKSIQNELTTPTYNINKTTTVTEEEKIQSTETTTEETSLTTIESDKAVEDRYSCNGTEPLTAQNSPLVVTEISIDQKIESSTKIESQPTHLLPSFASHFSAEPTNPPIKPGPPWPAQVTEINKKPIDSFSAPEVPSIVPPGPLLPHSEPDKTIKKPIVKQFSHDVSPSMIRPGKPWPSE